MTGRAARAWLTGWRKPAPAFCSGCRPMRSTCWRKYARGLRRLAAVRGFRISGAAAPAALVAELMDHGVTAQSGYGMTETCSHQYTRPDDPPGRIVETSGRACDGYEVRIWRQDDPDIEAAPGEIDEIGGRGARLLL